MPSALVVDDDPRIRTVVGRICSDLDLDVVEAGDGVQAVERLKSGQFDVVLLDLAMPHMDGLSVLKWMREEGIDPVPAVIILTALADAEAKVQGTDLGALDFIEKPFRIPDVQRRVGRALAIIRLERRLRSAEEAFEEMRQRDPVTGVEASAQLYEALEAEFLGARVGRRALSCVVVSDEAYDGALDGGGRPAGEERLQVLAQQIEDRLRGSDRVFRIDASEFVLLLPGTRDDGVKRVVDKITGALTEIEALDPDDIAIAVATYPHPEITQASVLYRAVNITLAKVRSRENIRIEFFQGF